VSLRSPAQTSYRGFERPFLHQEKAKEKGKPRESQGEGKAKRKPRRRESQEKAEDQ
jgi:hypothetical protein